MCVSFMIPSIGEPPLFCYPPKALMRVWKWHRLEPVPTTLVTMLTSGNPGKVAHADERQRGAPTS
jgi:hypothetical protein